VDCVSGRIMSGVSVSERRTVEDGIHQSDVQTAAEHNHFEQEHPDRPCQDDNKQLAHVLLLEFARGESVCIPLLSHLFCLPFKHNRSVRFRHQQNEGPRDTCEDGLQPVHPPPRNYRNVSTCKRAPYWTPCSSSHEYNHCPATGFRIREHVGIYASGDGDGCTSTNTSKEAHDDQARP
jgi:hypothetical protein